MKIKRRLEVVFDNEAEFNKVMGLRLSIRRKFFKCTQEKLAGLLQTTQGTLSKIENGTCSISAYQWELLRRMHYKLDDKGWGLACTSMDRSKDLTSAL